ncbi:hypothetical protein Zmor_023993 [Zophobas morio]|uniref:Cytoplasmic tRNA 2-thiolation protein 2 n=1 Tax=Zophobas morio TaxID=2755281 RepID=A0AA38M7Z8_9CUCU|nr:hypothetical protein Zmor_023993 [Zophobas morio]
MCNVGDDNFDDLENSKYMPAKEKISPFSKCNKCREATPIVVLRSKDKYCKECFLSGTVHKFKALLGKHKLIRPNDRVLVVHRCGHAGTALLHFIRTGLDLGTHKKLRFEPVVLFVEDHSHLSLKERQELLKRVEHEINYFKFTMHLTSLSHLIRKGVNSEVLKNCAEILDLDDDSKSIIDNFVTKQTNTTNKTDFLNIARHKFMVDIAKELNCKFIFTPEISSDVASQLLTDVSLGRGSHIALNTGFCDFRDDTVKILRPLRLFDMKELGFYNHLNSLNPVTYRIVIDNPYKSIQHLMRKFVNDLQVNYPATVTTILKTGDKLALGSNKIRTCDLCNAPFEEESADLNSAESTQFSHWVSTQAHNSSLTSQERYIQTIEAFNNLTCDTYCFRCRQLMK